jgi:hypothetical protein
MDDGVAPANFVKGRLKATATTTESLTILP